MSGVHWGAVAGAWALGLAACSGEVWVIRPASDQTTTSTGSGEGAGGGVTTGGSGGTSQGGGGGSSGVGGGPCPDLGCAHSCPNDNYWLEDDGCPSCACAADLEMPAAPEPQHIYPSASLTVLDDRYVFELEWLYDVPMWVDEEAHFITAVHLLRDDPSFEPTEAKVTFFHPEDDGNPLAMQEGTFTLWGFWYSVTTVEPLEGFLSIRRVDDSFEGYVRFHRTDGPQSQFTAAGPFQVAVP
jgi:hypothetical protein